jgi:class 3 adenylate cyclase
MKLPAIGVLRQPRNRNRSPSRQGESAAHPIRPVAVETLSPPIAERRHVSVLFADLVGFTSLSESRDAEEVRDLLTRFSEVSRAIVERYRGRVENFIGDAVFAVWRTPVTHEDDAERAVRCGLELVDAISSMGEDVGAPGLAARPRRRDG